MAVVTHPVLTLQPLFYHLDEVDCRGNESMLSDCEHAGVGAHNCITPFEEAGVLCSCKSVSALFESLKSF